MGEINATRLLDDLTTLRSFGATGTGVVRPTFSDTDMAARRWLSQRMRDAALDAVIDGAGNVVGRSQQSGPVLVLGSHSDTQPTGGWLDGALGVIYALEVARSLADDPSTRDLAVDVVAWSDEEGTYTSCLGSRSYVGDLGDQDLQHTNADGETAAEALDRVGLASTAAERLDPRRHIGYLEAHIEQGPHLEDRGLRLGVVTSIVGIRSMEVRVTGEQNHAGTTPMDRRKDAGVGLFAFGSRIHERLGALAGRDTVWTIGNARLVPGAESIVPGSARLMLQFRDPSDEILDRFEMAARELAVELTASGPVTVTAERHREPIPPTAMDPDLRAHLRDASESRLPGGWMEMPSAAGHDPMVLSHHLPCGMLFIPSIGGISHDFAEDSHTDDIVLGCQVLADAAVSILRS